jgi:hypothetical protein
MSPNDYNRDRYGWATDQARPIREGRARGAPTRLISLTSQTCWKKCSAPSGANCAPT